jgi:hypothetical protein
VAKVQVEVDERGMIVLLEDAQARLDEAIRNRKALIVKAAEMNLSDGQIGKAFGIRASAVGELRRREIRDRAEASGSSPQSR